MKQVASTYLVVFPLVSSFNTATREGRDKTILRSDLGVLEGSWVLGSLGLILGAILWQCDFRMFFGSILEPYWAAKGGQMEPKLDPKRTEIEDDKK